LTTIPILLLPYYYYYSSISPLQYVTIPEGVKEHVGLVEEVEKEEEE
jgi:hypothetical protein